MAYVCMVRLHDWYNLHTIFAPGFPGLVECFYIQERLIEHLLPEVHKTFVGLHFLILTLFVDFTGVQSTCIVQRKLMLDLTNFLRNTKTHSG